MTADRFFRVDRWAVAIVGLAVGTQPVLTGGRDADDILRFLSVLLCAAVLWFLLTPREVRRRREIGLRRAGSYDIISLIPTWLGAVVGFGVMVIGDSRGQPALVLTGVLTFIGAFALFVPSAYLGLRRTADPE